MGFCWASHLCLEDNHRILAASPYQESDPPGTPQDRDGRRSAAVHPISKPLLRDRVIVTDQDTPINTRDSVIATPWRARTGEVAVSSQANPHWSIEAGRE